jgi:hypothetical protein
MIPRTMLAVAYATGRASHARQVMTQTKRDTRPPGWRFGVGLATPHNKKLIVTKVEQRKKRGRCNDGGESWRHIGKNGRILLDRPKPTAGCTANGGGGGGRRRRYIT